MSIAAERLTRPRPVKPPGAVLGVQELARRAEVQRLAAANEERARRQRSAELARVARNRKRRDWIVTFLALLACAAIVVMVR